MDCVLSMTSLYYDPYCSPRIPLVTAVTAPPRFMGKERELTLECQSWDQTSKGEGHTSLENATFHPLSGFSICFLWVAPLGQCCCCCYVASVVSDSVRPHRRQPTRLRCPWDFPGKNTGVGCHFLLQCMKVKSESEVTQSCLTLSDPMACSPPGSSIHGIFQARTLEWGASASSSLGQ